jgi:hypothetical protein
MEPSKLTSANGCTGATTGCEWRFRLRSARGSRRGSWRRSARRRGERLFRQEHMCEFLQSEDCLFRQEDLDACLRTIWRRFFRWEFWDRRAGVALAFCVWAAKNKQLSVDGHSALVLPQEGSLAACGGSPTVRCPYYRSEDEPSTSNDESNDQPLVADRKL